MREKRIVKIKINVIIELLQFFMNNTLKLLSIALNMSRSGLLCVVISFFCILPGRAPQCLPYTPPKLILKRCVKFIARRLLWWSWSLVTYRITIIKLLLLTYGMSHHNYWSSCRCSLMSCGITIFKLSLLSYVMSHHNYWVVIARLCHVVSQLLSCHCSLMSCRITIMLS